jgi:hypothetical protein
MGHVRSRRRTVTDDHKTSDKAGDAAGTAAKVAGQAKAKATELAGHAAPLAKQAKAKATELAGHAAPLAGQAKAKASELASRAGPLAGQAKVKAVDAAHKAGVLAAHGVETTGVAVDKLTRGKYSDKIKAVTSNVAGMLDRDSAQHHHSAGGDGISPDVDPVDRDAAPEK